MKQNQKNSVLKTAKRMFGLLLLLTAFSRLSAQSSIPPLVVEADGEGPFSYQWYFNTDSSNVDGIPIAGATNYNYTPPAENGHKLFYYCVITNSCGTTTSAVSGSYTVFAVTGCNSAVPGFTGGNLGTISYGSAANTNINTNTTTISGNGINQTWSAHVFASGCNKTAYSGGSSGNFNTDCRKSIDDANRSYVGTNNVHYGDMFSWCAVMKYKDQLCPAPWRVPSKRDFINLDKALGGTGEERNSDTPPGIQAKYVGISGSAGQFWAGAWGGWCGAAGMLYENIDGTQILAGTRLCYWSAAESSVSTLAHFLFAHTTPHISPQDNSIKSYGHALRCVK